MKHRNLSLLCAFLFYCFAADVSAQSISGRVTANGAGIGNIVVVIFDAQENPVKLTTTQADGTYTAGGLGTGSYKVQFNGQDQGYINQWYNNKVDFNSADSVSVTNGTNTPNINAALTTGGSISGTVTANGAGIAILLVEIYNVNNTLDSSIYTAADGTYTARGLRTGSYKVKFYGSQKTGYPDQWYNNKGDFNSADTVSVTAPNNTPGINAALNNGGSISGRVTANGAGIGNIVVVIFDAQENPVKLTTTQADGTYTAGGLGTGSYKVQFNGQDQGYINQWYNNKVDFNSADSVSVTYGTNTPNINAVLITGGASSTTTSSVQPTTTTTVMVSTTTTTVSKLCPVKMMYGNDSENVTTLGEFRDKVLLNNPTGKEYVNLFYKHSLELTLILINNPDIRAKVQATLDTLLPQIKLALEGNVIVFNGPQIEQIRNVLDVISREAGSELHNAIQGFQEALKQQSKLFEDFGIKVETVNN